MQPRDVPGASQARAAGVVARDRPVERGADDREVPGQVDQRDAQVPGLAGPDDLLKHPELRAVVGAELRVAGRQPVRDVVPLGGGALDTRAGVDVLRVVPQGARPGQPDRRRSRGEAEPAEVDADVHDGGDLGRQELHEGEVLRVGAVLGAEVVGVDDVVASTLDLLLPVVVEHGALARRRAAEQHDQRDLGVLGAQVGDDLYAVLPVPAVVVAASLLADRRDQVGGVARHRRRSSADEGGHGPVAFVPRVRRRGDEGERGEAGGQKKDQRQPGRHHHGAAAEDLTSRRH